MTFLSIRYLTFIGSQAGFPVKQLKRINIRLAVKPMLKSLVKNGMFGRIHLRKKCEAGSKLEVIRSAENCPRIGDGQVQQNRRDLTQPCAQYGMIKLRFGLGEICDTVMFRGTALTQPFELREHKPHPVAFLAPGPQFLNCSFVNSFLSTDKSDRKSTRLNSSHVKIS